MDQFICWHEPSEAVLFFSILEKNFNSSKGQGGIRSLVLFNLHINKDLRIAVLWQ